jgi:hypothetical protein
MVIVRLAAAYQTAIGADWQLGAVAEAAIGHQRRLLLLSWRQQVRAVVGYSIQATAPHTVLDLPLLGS